MQSQTTVKKAVILYNPFAGRGKAAYYAQLVRSTLQNHQWNVLDSVATQYAFHIEKELAAEWEPQVQMIVLIGGDGTLRELVSGLRSANSCTKIAFIPLGNANVVARELNIPLQPEKAIQLFIEGRTKKVDLALITDQDGREIVFLAMIEIGIGADIVKAVNQLRNGSLKTLYRVWGDIVYAIGGLLAAIKHKEPNFRLSVDKTQTPIETSHVIISNMQTYAKGWSFSPQAHCDDGILNISIRGKKGIINIAKALISAAQKTCNTNLMTYHTSESIDITSSTKISAQVDGDPISLSNNVTVSVESKAFNILIPSNK